MTHVTAVVRRTSWRDDPRAVSNLRFAFAVTLSLALAQTINWPINFVHPALVIGLMSMPGPNLRESLANAGYALVAPVLCVTFALFFLTFPLAFLIAFPLVIFLTMYAMFKGAPFLFCILMILGLAIMPLVGAVHDIVSLTVAGSFIFSALMTVLVVQISFGLLPEPPGSPTFGSAFPVYQPEYSAKAARTALGVTMVLTPAMIAFLALKWTSELVVLLFMFLIAMGGSLAESRYTASKYLKANAIGGLGAVVFYVFLIVVPEIHFLILLVLFTALLFGAKIFSDDPHASYYSSGIIGLVILVSSSMGPGADVGVNALMRVFFILLAGTYVILALPVAERLAARLIHD